MLTGTVLFGRGVQTKKYEHGAVSQSENDTANKFNLGYSLGFNGESFYAGMSYVQNETEYRMGSLKVEPNLSSTRFFLGIRF